MTSTHASPGVTSIPVVSLAQWREPGGDRGAFAAELIRACHEVGFFTLVDHGIEQDAIDAYFAALQAFFALPEEVKARIDKAQSPHFRGWERVGAELTDNRVDYREQLDLSSRR